MRPPTRTALLAVAVLIAVGVALLVALGSPSGRPSSTGASAGGSGSTSLSGFDGALLPSTAPARNFTLTDQQSGQRISLAAYRGQVTILTFLRSTSTTTGPLIAQQIRGALDELAVSAPAVPALAVSLDPAADTPAHVRSFLAKASLTGRLEYLTGTPDQLRQVWRAFRIVPPSAARGDVARSAYVLLIDRRGFERVSFPVEQLTPEGLAHDIRKLQHQS
jgi:protein SCO1/2